MYYHCNWNINLYNLEVELMKKFLKENWQYLIIGIVSIGICVGIFFAVFSALITWIMNVFLWILELLVTQL